MMQEEFEVPSRASTWASTSALVTFFSFVIAGLIPVVPFLFLKNISSVFMYSIVATGCTLFVVGSLRALVTRRSWFISGLEMFAVGGVAAGIAYGVGLLLSSVV